MIATAMLVMLLATPPSLETRPGGLEIVTIARPGHPRAHLRIAVASGSLADPPGKSGLSKVVAAALSATIRTQPLADGRSFAALGAALTAGAGATSIALTAECDRAVAPQVLSAIFEVLATRWVNPEAVRDAIRAAERDRNALATDDRALALEALRHLVFGNHPAARPVGGQLADLATIDAEDVDRWTQANLRAPAVVVGVLADDPAALLDTVRALVDRLPPEGVPPLELVPTPARQAIEVVIVDRPTAPRSLAFVGQPASRLGTASGPAVLAGAASLGSGFTTDLRERLAEHGAKPIAAPMHARWLLGAGLFAVGLEARTSVVADGVAVVLDALRTIADQGPRPAETLRGRNRAETELRIAASSGAGRLAALIDARLAKVPLTDALVLADTIASTSTAAIGGALRRFVRPEGMSIVVIANASSRLSNALSRLQGVRSVRVVRYDSLP